MAGIVGRPGSLVSPVGREQNTNVMCPNSLSLSLSMCAYRLSKLLLSGLGHGEHGLHIEFSELPVICHLGLGLVSPFRSTGKAQPHIRVSEINP